MLFLVARNPKLTPAEFRDYYETKHVAVLRDICGTFKERGFNESCKPIVYTRRYIDREASDPKTGNPGISDLPPEDFDVVTEFGFESKDAAMDFVKLVYAVEEYAKRMKADEEVFTIPSKRKSFVIEECAGL